MSVQGNKNGNGKGRKSALKEHDEAEFLMDIWEGKIKYKDLQKLIKQKKHGAKHIFAYKCLQGNMVAIKNLTNKLFANKSSMALGFNDKTVRPDPNALSAKERREIERVMTLVIPIYDAKKDNSKHKKG